jgi:small subunit ribosomal protein S6
MILVTTAEAGRDWDGLIRHITDIITHNGGEIVDVTKWGEHKLAYEIRHQRKAVYILVHFNAPTNVVAEIRREMHLSERILRHLILVDEDGVEVKLLSDLEDEQERASTRRRRDRRDEEKDKKSEEDKKSDDTDESSDTDESDEGDDDEDEADDSGDDADDDEAEDDTAEAAKNEEEA